MLQKGPKKTAAMEAMSHGRPLRTKNADVTTRHKIYGALKLNQSLPYTALMTVNMVAPSLS